MIFKTGRSKRKINRLFSNSRLFDEKFYKEKYGLGRHNNAFQHYDKVGWKQGLNPSEFFDTMFYLETYNDVKSKSLNPLVHYLRHGGGELRRPTPTFDVQSYCALHSDFGRHNKTPAEDCIERYGSYDWQIESKGAADTSVHAIEFFESVFDRKFYASHNPDVVENKVDPYRHFIEFGQFEGRDPSPHINTYFLQSKWLRLGIQKKTFIDGYFDVERDNARAMQNDEGIIIEDFEVDAGKCAATKSMRLCVHIHCYYPELIGEIIPGLENIPENSFIAITVVSEADAHFIRSVLARSDIKSNFSVRIVPNRGRDIAPFIVGTQDIWRNYDLVLHLHTKISPHIDWGGDWRHYLFDQTLGSKKLVMQITDMFASDESLGCLYPRNYYKIREFVAAEHNGTHITSFLNTLGLPSAQSFLSDYPAGSMSWYRVTALSALADRVDNLSLFEEEAGQLDLTLAHVLERVIPETVRQSGFKVRNYTTYNRARLVPVQGLPGRDSSSDPVGNTWPRGTPKIAKRPPLPVQPLTSVYNPQDLNIHWILPSFSQAGAGGHMTIFRMVELLEKFGHHQTLWLQDAVHFADQREAKLRIQEWYRPIGDKVNVRFLSDDVREIAGDVLISTDWPTAFPASQVTNVKERFYFIQDYEPMFHAMGDLYLLADATYNFGFANLCAGRWLLNLMQSRGNWARSWELCADHEVYYAGVAKSLSDRPVRIAFYARQYTPRRAVTLGFAAFELMHKKGMKFVVELFGEEDLKIDFDFPHVQHGIMTPQALGELYRACDVGVVFSATNYSLIPLEMMACGLPVVELDTESTRAIFENNEVCFAETTPYGIVAAIENLIHDNASRESQRARGFAFVRATSWEQSARTVENALLGRLAESGFKELELKPLPSPPLLTRAKVSIFIPTFNAGANFEAVLRAVSSQKCDFVFDVIIIDSGSTDGTLERLQNWSHCRIRTEKIAKSEFQHGRTRNLGIELAESDYVALITQDACPKNSVWLSNLISGFSRGRLVAGVIGRHEAYPHHDPFTIRDIRDTFDNIALMPPVVSKKVGLPSFVFPGSINWGMNMRFYSDNNSAISKAAWKMLPYPNIDWGEDQVWADEALRLGFEKAYVDDAVIFHSHSFDLPQQYAVSVTEGGFWAKYFGVNLHPDPEAAIRYMNDRDRQYALKFGIGDSHLQHRVLHNRATVFGRHEGYLSQKIE